jgi:hypothetical protein
MTGMCGQHEGRLSVAIAGIRINTPPKKIKDDLDVTTLDRILPGGNHQSKTPDPLFCLAEALFFRLTPQLTGGPVRPGRVERRVRMEVRHRYRHAAPPMAEEVEV